MKENNEKEIGKSDENPELDEGKSESSESSVELHDEGSEPKEQSPKLLTTIDVKRKFEVTKKTKATQTKKVKIISLPTSEEDEPDDTLHSELAESVQFADKTEVSVSEEATEIATTPEPTNQPAAEPSSILSILPRIEPSRDGNTIKVTTTLPMSIKRVEEMEADKSSANEELPTTSVGKKNHRPSSPSKGAIPKKRKQEPVPCSCADVDNGKAEDDNNAEISPPVRRDDGNYDKKVILSRSAGDDDKTNYTLAAYSELKLKLVEMKSSMNQELRELSEQKEKIFESDNSNAMEVKDGPGENSAVSMLEEINKSNLKDAINESSSPTTVPSLLSSFLIHQQIQHRSLFYKRQSVNSIDSENPSASSEQLILMKPEEEDEDYLCNCRIQTHPEKLYFPTDNNRPHCNLCDISFGRYSSYYQHVAQFHSTISKFVCNLCRQWFSNLIALKTHMAKCENKCALCNKQFNNSNELINHFNLHEAKLNNLEGLINANYLALEQSYFRLRKTSLPDIMEQQRSRVNKIGVLDNSKVVGYSHRYRTRSTPRNIKFTMEPRSSRELLGEPSNSKEPPSNTENLKEPLTSSFIEVSSNIESSKQTPKESTSSGEPPKEPSSNKKPESNIPCRLCTNTFNSIQSLRAHQEKEHFTNLMENVLNNNKSCDKCKRVVLPKPIDFKSPKYRCKQCIRQFFLEEHLKEHEIVHKFHNQLLRNPCCQLEFRCSSMKFFHTVIHPSYVQCDDCGLLFENDLKLRDHKYLKTRGEQFGGL